MNVDVFNSKEIHIFISFNYKLVINVQCFFVLYSLDDKVEEMCHFSFLTFQCRRLSTMTSWWQLILIIKLYETY